MHQVVYSFQAQPSLLHAVSPAPLGVVHSVNKKFARLGVRIMQWDTFPSR